ncbi:hypothetical protein FOC69_00335 (plasmid) [Bacteroides fragilis]|uniref:Uncharacterized protein n=1 Tax=Bacteroides fragilis TaxID=817 RepID=A0AAP9NA01_BACFG|nr:hypothetical protein [Bacteroides fragilis]QKH82895.1 hypothetical protein FOC69_00335 [Bacteroides fragilis]
MTEYLATNYSLFDLAIVTIVIVSILILGLVYFSGSKKKRSVQLHYQLKKKNLILI